MQGNEDAGSATRGKFVLRTPMLPATYLTSLLPDERISCVMTGVALPREQMHLLRTRRREILAAVCANDTIFEALRYSSDSLVERLASQADAATPGYQKSEWALLRYLTRMATRPTPFGTSATITICPYGGEETTNLASPPPSNPRVRASLDWGLLLELYGRIKRSSRFRQLNRYRVNETAYRTENSYRYMGIHDEAGTRIAMLNVASANAYLDWTIEYLATPARIADIVDALRLRFRGVTLASAEKFVDNLVCSDLIVPIDSPPLLGDDALPALNKSLLELGYECPIGTALRQIENLLAPTDDAPQNRLQTYREVTDILANLGVESSLSQTVNITAFLDLDFCSISGKDVEYLIRHAERLLARAYPATGLLSTFRNQFVQRFGDIEVPLLEAVDIENGVPCFASTRPVPLLASFRDRGYPDTNDVGSPLERLLHAKCLSALELGASEVSISDADLDTIKAKPEQDLPERFSLLLSVVDFPTDRHEKETGFLWHSVSYGSSFNLFGRYSHHIPEIADLVASLSALEASVVEERGALLADICYLPTARLGNVVTRTATSGYFIPILASVSKHAGAPLPLTDLTVSVRDGAIKLRSKTLDREVIPRLGNAHHFLSKGPGLYKFLCMVQYQDTPELRFGWPASLDRVTYRQRITYGKLVLAPATWFFRQQHLVDIRRCTTLEQRLGELSKLVRRWRLPVRITLQEQGQYLDIDLELLASVELLLEVMRTRDSVTLTEALQPPISTRQTAGAVFKNEVILPIVRRRAAGANVDRKIDIAGKKHPPTDRRVWMPGSEWMYIKLFCTPDGADDLIRMVVAPLMKELGNEGIVDRWYFVRYNEPQFHLRLRIYSGDKASLWGTGFARILERLTEGDQSPWQVQLDSYFPEEIRYGGTAGLDSAEHMFYHDSRAFIDVLQLPLALSGHATRWKVAAISTDFLLQEFGLSHAQRVDFCKRMAVHQATALGFASTFNARMGKLYRETKNVLIDTLSGAQDGYVNGELRQIYAARTLSNIPWVEHYRALFAESRQELDGVLASLCHMSCNRIFRTEPRKQEMVTMGLLQRYYLRLLTINAVC